MLGYRLQRWPNFKGIFFSSNIFEFIITPEAIVGLL